MRQHVVLLQLDDLGVNHHEAQLIRCEAIEQRRDDGIDADGFARASAAGDQTVGHLREIGDDRMAVNILAERDGNPRLGVAPFVRLEQVAHDDLGLTEFGTSTPTELCPAPARGC